jgi:hypothetical protein
VGQEDDPAWKLLLLLLAPAARLPLRENKERTLPMEKEKEISLVDGGEWWAWPVAMP